MLDLLFKLLPMIISLTLSQLIYLKIDKDMDITNKISTSLNITPKWQSLFCALTLIFCLLLVATLGIYIIELPTFSFSILCGSITGTSIGITNNMKIKNA